MVNSGQVGGKYVGIHRIFAQNQKNGVFFGAFPQVGEQMP